MTFLLDVNVLIALIDPRHRHNLPAIDWFESVRAEGWATSPLTENGTVRIVGSPRYLNTPGSPSLVAEVLRQLRRVGKHEFWPDDISIVESPFIDPEALTSHKQVTDSYLLALAASKGGRFATFDARLRTDAVRGGDEALHIIPTP